MAELLGPGASLQHSLEPWTGQTGEHKNRAFPSQLQSLLAITGSLQDEVLPLVLY